MMMRLDSPRSVVGKKKHTVLLTIPATMVLMLAVVEATGNFKHRRLDDTGHASMDTKSPDAQKHLDDSNSRTAALVEEVFGPTAVVEADESRRIYAISIPGIYPEDGPYPGRPSGYQPPVYRPKHPHAGHDEEVYSSFEGAQSPTSSKAFPQHYWKSGLRLIVSGPAETELPIASSAAQNSFEYSHNRPPPSDPVSRFEGRRPSTRDKEFAARDFEDFTRQLDHRGNVPPHSSIAGDDDYRSPIRLPNHSGVKVRPLNDHDSRSLSNGGYRAGSRRPYANGRHEDEETFFRGDSFGDFRDYIDGRGYLEGGSPFQDDEDREEHRSKLPSGFVLHGEPSLSKLPLSHPVRDHPQSHGRPSRPRDSPHDESPSYAIDVSHATPQNEESAADVSSLETPINEENPHYFNRPYPKLASPHNVAGLRDHDKTASGDLPAPQSDERVSPTTTDFKTDDKKASNPSALDSPPLDYYDDLYEEFMQSAYNDYYDDAPSDTPKSESNRAPSSQQEASDRKLPGVKLSAPDDRDVELVAAQVSHTRRDPPSDMYTTSRSVGLAASSSPARGSGEQSTIRISGKNGESTSERTSSSSTSPSPPSSSSIASIDLSDDHSSDSEVTDSFKTPKVTAPDHVATSDNSRSDATKIPVTSTGPPVTTQGPATSTSQHPYRSSVPTSTKISLSEVLQNIGLSLPQFLIQLKTHKMDLKQFTSKLEKRSLTQTELKRAEGNLGMLLKILEETSPSADIQPSPAYEPITSERPIFKILSHDPELKMNTEQETTLPSASTTIPSLFSTTEEPSTLPERISSTTPITTLPPKKFGFRPSTDINTQGQFVIQPNITSVDDSADETSSRTFEETKADGATSDIEASIDKAKVTYRPYRPTLGNWKERMGHNRGVSGRLGTTTRRPKVRPAYSYYGGETDLKDLIAKQNEENKKSSVGSDDEESFPAKKESSIFLSKGESTVIGLTEGTPLGGSYDHPRYDRDPNSLNIATRSAIMAAGILGGIALAVFITIFVFVMYRNHVGKRRLRVPFPVSISSDESVSSTPELYSTRSRIGLGGRTSSSRTDFWGTLRRKFDPYSLNSSTASYY